MPEGLQKAFCIYCGSEIIVSRLGAVARMNCPVCGGTGRVDICKACNGTGRCTWSTNSPGVRTDILAIGYSAYCDNGTCSACKGSGRYNYGGCPGCEGTGRCPRCLGSGRCAACHGTGRLPNASGAESCPECNGAGLVDPGAPSAVARGEQCPECKRPWVKGQEYCSYCGYRRNLCPKCGAIWVTGTLTCKSCGFSPDAQPSDGR